MLSNTYYYEYFSLFFFYGNRINKLNNTIRMVLVYYITLFNILKGVILDYGCFPIVIRLITFTPNPIN